MIGLARCRPWQSKLIFRAVSSASPHCTDAKPEGGGSGEGEVRVGANREGGFGDSAWKIMEQERR